MAEPLDLEAIKQRWHAVDRWGYTADFVAGDVPTLIAEVERLRAAVAAAYEIGYREGEESEYTSRKAQQQDKDAGLD